MSSNLVVLVNPNMVFPPVAPYALDVLTTALEDAGFDVDVVDLTFAQEEWRYDLTRRLRGKDPLLVGITIRNTDSVYAYEQRSFLPGHKQVVDLIRSLTAAPLVAGGVGFSTMAYALTDYLGVDFAVKGPGEQVLQALAMALRDGLPPADTPGLLVNEGNGTVLATPAFGGDPTRRAQVNRTTGYRRRSGRSDRVDNLAYYRAGGLGNILTKNGCVYTCTHCVEPDAKGTTFATRDVVAVVDEMESMAAQGVLDLHTTDSEFNLAIATSKRLLREVVRRKESDATTPLHDLRLWVYCQPRPFDEEFADLLAGAGCAGVNVGTDHVRPEVLANWKVGRNGRPFYDFEDTSRLVRLCRERGMKTMVEALFGMPGETVETMADAVDRLLGLDATVAAFSLGLRLFPYIGLGRQLAEACDGVRTVPGLQSNTASGPIVLKPLHQCTSRVEYERQFMFDESGRTRLVCYFSPELPEDPATVASPSGRWYGSVRWLWDRVPRSELHRVMLPTVEGISEHDNNYVDNPFLTSLTGLGYTGAFWAHWRERELIMARAQRVGALAPVGA